MKNHLTNAIILAAGKGSRLDPLTRHRSKAMMPVLGVPIIERILENLLSNGLRDFIIVAQPNDLKLIRYFRCQSRLDVQIHLVFQHQPRGTADALRKAAPLLQDDFILSSCDSLIDESNINHLITTWRSNPHLGAALALMPISDPDIEYGGIVEMDGDHISKIIEKPAPRQTRSHISSLPLYCFSPRILEFLQQVPLSPRGEYEIQDAIQMLIENNIPVEGVFVDQRLSLTNPKDLLAINLYYLKKDSGYAKSSFSRIGRNCQLKPPYHTESGTIIGNDCSIGPSVYIERNCRIGDRVRLQNAVVLEGVSIVNNTAVDGNVIFNP